MKKITFPTLLKLNLVLILLLFATVFDVSGQISTNRSVSSKNDVSINTDNFSHINDAVINEYSTAIHSATPQSRPMIAPFNCESGLIYIITNTSSSNGNVSGLHSFNLGTQTQTLIKYPLVESTNSSQFVNGIGYNVVDNYLYGILQGTDQLVKIDSTGAMEYFTITGDYTIGDFSSGDVDKNGVLYIYGQGKFVSINLNPSAPDYLEAKTLLRNAKTFHDMAFSPIDDNVYIVTSDSRRTLLRFDVTTNTLTELGNVSGLTSESSNSFGTAFMDSMGNLYISNNVSGNIYKITSPHTGGLVATPFNTLAGSPGDGARCPYESISPNAVNDQVCLIERESITIDLIQNDGSGTYPIDVASVQLIDPVTNETSTSITVAGQGTFSVDNEGILTFTPLTSFSDASIEYTISDTVGLVSNPASITVSINTTSAPTGDSIQTFCAAESLTINALKATGSSIRWYDSLTGTTPLLSSAVLTNGATYYASQVSGNGCESVERLAVSVSLYEGVTLLETQTTSCINNKTAYQIEATFKGNAEFTASGLGAPGVFTDNGDQTTTWTSSPINASELTYSVSIQEANNCNPIVLSGDAPVECLATPFDCSDGLAFILTNTGTDQSNYVTGLYTLNLSTNVQSLVKYPLVNSGDQPYQFINAIGYNTMDNFLYGLLQRTNKIVRIDTAGNIEYFEITGSFTTGYYSSGDMDHIGNLYLYNGTQFVSVNLDPTSPDYLKSTNLLSYSASVNDLAFNTIDNNLYMVTSTSTPHLLRYDLAANAVIDLGAITGLDAENTSSFGTAFMDSMGNMFIANNSSGNTYKIPFPHAGGVDASFYSSAMSGLQPGDGARCQDAITLPVANDDVVCLPEGTEEVLANILANDGEGSFPLDPSSVELLDPVSSESASTVEVEGQGTFVLDANGVVTFTPLDSFTEASVQYTVKDNILNMTQPATLTVYLSKLEVVCPTFPELTVECYEQLPNETSYTIAEFEALGNGDGLIKDSYCGIIQITAENSPNNASCSQTITRTYTITEYEDTNRNGRIDATETKVLNSTECTQIINVVDTTAPNLVTDYEKEINISCDSIPAVPELVFEDACSTDIQVVFDETSTATEGNESYVVTRTWTVSDNCDNEAIFTQIINVDTTNNITVATGTELCNDDNINFDLFDLLSGTYDTDGTWSIVGGSATLDGSLFNPYGLELGTYTFMYTLTDEYCTSETLVDITLNDDCVVLPCGAEDVIISKAVTTYADGKNDFFTVTGVETCGFTVELQIFNRWGAMIYESKNYQNDWNGTSSKASIGSSNFVPTGTYYYVINLKNSGLEPFAGPIYVATK